MLPSFPPHYQLKIVKLKNEKKKKQPRKVVYTYIFFLSHAGRSYLIFKRGQSVAIRYLFVQYVYDVNCIIS